MKIFAKDYDIFPGKEVAEEVNALFGKLAENEEEKELIFEKGTYFLASEHCLVEHYHITNTIGEKEYDDNEEKWKIVIGLHLKNIKNLVVDGNGSTFVIDGVATNMAVVGCENVTVKNLEIKTKRPNVHRLYVKKRSLFAVKMAIDEDDPYEIRDGEICFVGKDYVYPLLRNKTGRAFNYGREDDPLFLSRCEHPLLTARTVRAEGNTLFAKGFFPKKRVQKGFEFYLFDWRRRQVGTFLWQSKNVLFDGFKQRFSYSLAFVCQDCDTVTWDNVTCTPEGNKAFQYCSVADFIQICCCRGQFTVRNSRFSSSGDDVLNVHGIHFKIEKICGKEMTVRFCHPQAYGFNIFHAGDSLSVVGRRDLLEKAQCKVISSEMLDLYTVQIKLSEELSPTFVGEVIENASACPDLLFENNEMERVTTRGLLLTTRGKIVIKDNRFLFTRMKSIEIADDAMDWYESGMVRDLTVENNDFSRCTQPFVHIWPHNLVRKGFVHNHITFRNNRFSLQKNPCYVIRDTGDVQMIENKYIAPKGYKKHLVNRSSEIKKKDF